jgi:hypothetical protein
VAGTVSSWFCVRCTASASVTFWTRTKSGPLCSLSCTVVTPTRLIDLAPSTLLFVNTGAVQPTVQTRPVQCYHNTVTGVSSAQYS